MRYLLCLFLLLATPCYAMITACPQAQPTNSPQFCSTFITAATCHCTQTGLPQGMCQDLNDLYERMIALFGSLEQACYFQQDTDHQTCVDDWNCYRNGGTDSQGRLCNANGQHC